MSPILQSAEHNLDTVAAFVTTLVVSGGIRIVLEPMAHHGSAVADGMQIGVHATLSSPPLGKDALIAPALPTIAECLEQPVFLRRIPPPQPIAMDEDNATQDPPIIDAGFTVGFRKDGRKTQHLRIRQPEKIRHAHRSAFEP